MVQRRHIVGEAGPSGRNVDRLSYLPSVIVSENDPAPFAIARAPVDAKTARARGVLREAVTSRLGASTVLLLLAISLAVFGMGIVALVYTRSADVPITRPLVNAADLPPPQASMR